MIIPDSGCDPVPPNVPVEPSVPQIVTSACNYCRPGTVRFSYPMLPIHNASILFVSLFQSFSKRASLEEYPSFNQWYQLPEYHLGRTLFSHEESFECSQKSPGFNTVTTVDQAPEMRYIQ